jgi:poly(hydroxyalkanoate) depolymerase family esterase
MTDFRKVIGRIQVLRQKFEALLDAAREKAGRVRVEPVRRATPLKELSAFGSNPGNLRMFVSAPERLPSLAPLVVALHGCSQSAEEYDQGTGWSSLANRVGCVVIFPEQQPANNPKNCFSWFFPSDTSRGHGEALSIQQMIEHAIATFGVDRRRVFVTGLSAGGAMASVMLATYPEIFAGGAIIAGLPYGCARSVQEAFEAMFTEQSHSAQALGERVRKASKHRGPWPKISVWHGTADPIVKPCNAGNIVRQWTDIHELSETPSYEELIGTHTRRVWNDANGEPCIEAFSISGMAHGVPLATTAGQDGCGAAGAFFLEVGISSTHRIANFWRLGDNVDETQRAPALLAEPRQISAADSAMAVVGPVERRSYSGETAIAEVDQPNAGLALDPNRVIAAAFKAAGLPIPEGSNRSPDTVPHVAPGPIIEAALKAAGLTGR